MNKYLGLVFMIICMSCSEVPVVLPIGSGPSTGAYTQNVLIEEYTGVRCQNCPAGAQTLEELKIIHGERLVIVSIHGGFFAQPPNLENKLRLDNTSGQELINIFNQPLGYPSGMINRKVFESQSSRFLGGNFWAGYVQSEKIKAPALGIELDIQHTPAQKQIRIECDVHGLMDLSGEPLRLSICIIENKIKDAQLTPTGVDTAYIHNHVLRTFVSSIQGDVLKPIVVNDKKTYTYSATYPTMWNPDQLAIVAFIHNPGPSYEVIQVVEKKVK